MRILSLCIALICLLPVVLVGVVWIVPQNPETLMHWQHIRETVLWDYVAHTALLATGVAMVTLLFGVMIGWWMTTCEFGGRKILSWMLILPFAMPSYILATVYGNLLEFAGPVQTTLREWFDWQKEDYWFPAIRSSGGGIFLLSLVTFPYVYMMARLAFISQPAEWFDMAQSLGKTRRQRFWQMALPAARPFIVVGVLLAVMETIADIGAVHMLGIPTLSVGIYRTWFYYQQEVAAAQLASLLMGVAALMVWCEQISRRGAVYHAQLTGHAPARRTLKPIKGFAVACVCALPAVLGFIIPVLWLIRMSMFHTVEHTFEEMIAYLSDSLLLAGSAAVLVVACALVLSANERFLERVRHYTPTHIAATLGYAMPGVVIAVGLLLIQQWLRAGWDAVPMLVTGSVAGLLIAYLIRFLSPAYGALHSGFQRIPPQTEMIAASLGKSKIHTILRVHVPMLKWPILTAALIVAIDVLKELPATLILRPFDIKPLSLAIYEFAGDDRPHDAAPLALTLIALSTLAVVALTRLQEREHG